MLVIRLRRAGRKHDPHYRIVIAEHTAPVQGKFIADVGHYHPKSKQIGLQKDQFLNWLEKGATPSNTIAKLATREGITHKQVNITEYHGKPKQKAQERSTATQAKPADTTTSAETKEETKPETAKAPEATATKEAAEISPETVSETSRESTDSDGTPAHTA